MEQRIRLLSVGAADFSMPNMKTATLLRRCELDWGYGADVQQHNMGPRQGILQEVF